MLSHMYPSAVNWTAGIFVHEQVRALVALGHDVRVVSPKGIAPPLLPRWRAFHDVPGVDVFDGVPVLYPRKLTLPGGRLGHRNSDAMLWAIRKPLGAVRRAWPFDVIHAHMLVPDGWAAARIGAEAGVPVVATAHRADVLDVPAQGPRSSARVTEAVESIDQICAVSASIGAGGGGGRTPPPPGRGGPRRRRSAPRAARCGWSRTAPTRGSSRRAPHPRRAHGWGCPTTARSCPSWASWCPARASTR
jgi:glycosyltransferase involved in cell wall biosynthesis